MCVSSLTFILIMLVNLNVNSLASSDQCFSIYYKKHNTIHNTMILNCLLTTYWMGLSYSLGNCNYDYYTRILISIIKGLFVLCLESDVTRLYTNVSRCSGSFVRLIILVKYIHKLDLIKLEYRMPYDIPSSLSEVSRQSCITWSPPMGTLANTSIPGGPSMVRRRYSYPPSLPQSTWTRSFECSATLKEFLSTSSDRI